MRTSCCLQSCSPSVRPNRLAPYLTLDAVHLAIAFRQYVYWKVLACLFVEPNSSTFYFLLRIFSSPVFSQSELRTAIDFRMVRLNFFDCLEMQFEGNRKTSREAGSREAVCKFTVSDFAALDFVISKVLNVSLGTPRSSEQFAVCSANTKRHQVQDSFGKDQDRATLGWLVLNFGSLY